MRREDAAKSVPLQFGSLLYFSLHCLHSAQICRSIGIKLNLHELDYAFFVDPDDDLSVDFIVHDKSMIFSIDGETEMVYLAQPGLTTCFDFDDDDDAFSFIDKLLDT